MRKPENVQGGFLRNSSRAPKTAVHSEAEFRTRGWRCRLGYWLKAKDVIKSAIGA